MRTFCVLFCTAQTLALRSLSQSRPFSQLTAPIAAAAVMPAGDKWYTSGLSFKCTLCGNCCSGTTGSVRFTDLEAEQMAAKLTITTDDFYSKYTRKRGKGATAHVELKEIRAPDGKGYDCVFLDRQSMPGKAICSLYKQRPLQCKTWPFWNDIIETPQAWEAAKLGPEGCPGLGKGDVVPYAEIVRLRDMTDP